MIFETKEKIENGFFDVNEEADCEWCDFKKICGGKIYEYKDTKWIK